MRDAPCELVPRRRGVGPRIGSSIDGYSKSIAGSCGTANFGTRIRDYTCTRAVVDNLAIQVGPKPQSRSRRIAWLGGSGFRRQQIRDEVPVYSRRNP